MKVVHLNTHSYGGAATVARRLHCALSASGIDSRFVTLYGLSSDRTSNFRALKSSWLRYSMRSLSADRRLYRLGKTVQQWQQHPNLANRPAGFDLFSPLNTRLRWSDCAREAEPDVIHLHWINGFVDHADFFEQNNDRKFVWTLHDMNPLTGGCHHSDGCDRFVTGCRGCPQLAGTIDQGYAERVLAAKQQNLRTLRDEQLTIVAPSRWLLELSARSPVTGRFRHVYIENPGPAQAAVDRNQVKRALGIPLDRKVVAFAAANLRNPRKGFDLVFAALRRLAERDRVQLLGIGQRGDAQPGLHLKYVGAVADESEVTRYLCCADAVVVPSVAENAPLTVIEAHRCGVPVVAFAVGGIPEMISAENGVVVGERNADALASALDDVLFRREFNARTIVAAAERYAPGAVANKYKRVYEELVLT